MNKLREKFDWYLSGGENCPESEQCEQISDDFAVKFAEWFVLNRYESEVGFYNATELLQIFKTNFYE